MRDFETDRTWDKLNAVLRPVPYEAVEAWVRDNPCRLAPIRSTSLAVRLALWVKRVLPVAKN